MTAARVNKQPPLEQPWVVDQPDEGCSPAFSCSWQAGVETKTAHQSHRPPEHTYHVPTKNNAAPPSEQRTPHTCTHRVVLPHDLSCAHTTRPRPLRCNKQQANLLTHTLSRHIDAVARRDLAGSTTLYTRPCKGLSASRPAGHCHCHSAHMYAHITQQLQPVKTAALSRQTSPSLDKRRSAERVRPRQAPGKLHQKKGYPKPAEVQTIRTKNGGGGHSTTSTLHRNAR